MMAGLDERALCHFIYIFLCFFPFFIENFNFNLNQKGSLVAVLQQRDIFMPTKTGSGKSKLPGHLRLCDKNSLILNIYFFIKKKIKSTQ